MYRFYLAAADMLPSAVLLIPVYWLLNRVYFHNAGKSILYFLFSCYLSIIYVLVGLPNVTYVRAELNLNLIPFAGMVEDWKNCVLNILLFVPLGMMLPILWKKFTSIKKTSLFGFAISLTIEILQILTYRTTDINDLLTNTAGTISGFFCAMYLLKKIPKTRHVADKTKSEELKIILSVVLLVMFFIYPFVSAALWDFILL